jgi:hypothetical protein
MYKQVVIIYDMCRGTEIFTSVACIVYSKHQVRVCYSVDVQWWWWFRYCYQPFEFHARYKLQHLIINCSSHSVLTPSSIEELYFLSIILCSPLKVSCHFRRTCHLHLLAYTASRQFLVWFTLQPWRGRQHVPPKCQLTFSGLHGIISRKVKQLLWDSASSSVVKAELQCILENIISVNESEDEYFFFHLGH